MILFNVQNVFFTVLGYPMSYIEFSATLLIVVYVLLITKKIVWAWPLGIITFSLFAGLFYQIRLYSDFFEQFYYIGNCFYGWRVWLASRKKNENANEPDVSYCTGRARLIAGLIIAVGGGLLGFTMSRIHTYLPSLFPKPAAYPYIDAFATIMGFVAAALMTHKKIESWLLWICVNIICIGLYYARDVKFVAILYVFFLALAINGLISWTKDILKIEAKRPYIAHSATEDKQPVL
jgi:nicotinamide mononucleotide transporter